MSSFHCVDIETLVRQLRLGPAHLRHRQIKRAEELIANIDQAKEYPYEFVYHWITGTQIPQTRRTSRPRMLSGRSLLADVAALILELSDSLDLKLDDLPEEPVPLEDLARKHNVSIKTISRWRKRGLSARRVIFPDGRRRIVFLPSSLESFAARHGQLILEGSKFQRISAKQRDEIINQARLLYQQGNLSPYQVCVRLARQQDRAIETVRTILRKHDQLHPEQPVFASTKIKLSDEQRRRLYEDFSDGAHPSDLSRRYRRSRSSVYRLIGEFKSRLLESQTIEYIYSPQFDLPGFGDRLGPLAEAPPIDTFVSQEKMPEFLQKLCEEPPLTHTEEMLLFRRYNYLKFRAELLRQRLKTRQNPAGLTPIQVVPNQPEHYLASGPIRKAANGPAKLMEEMESLLDQAMTVKNLIIQANLRLVVNIAKRHLGTQTRLFELISDGNIALMRAVEKFDYSRRYRFSTYATWAISRNYARTIPQANYQLQHYITGQEEMLDVAADGRSNGQLLRPEVLAQRDLLADILRALEPRERHILMAHFGLGRREKPDTLEAIGQSMGLSKQRVRQIEARALRKIRQLVRPQPPPQKLP